MSNYYDYCKTISDAYYPKIYKKINYYIELELKEIDKDRLHPFPRSKDFECIVEGVYKRYKKYVNEKIIEGKFSHNNYTNEDLVLLTKDLIKILVIQRIMKDREHFKDYPFYY